MQSNVKIRKACPHPYFWLARFNDEEIAQYTEEGKEVLYREVLNRIEAGKGLSFISWVPVKEGKPTYTQHIDSSWQRPIVLRRGFITVGLRDGKERGRHVVFLLGWQATIAGRNFKSVMFIDPETGDVEVRSEL